VLVSFVYVVACRLFALVLLLARSDRSKELELLVLRHELSILRRAERWVGSVRRECLDRLLIFGRRQLEHVLRVYIRHFNQHRPHRALDLRPPDRGGGTDPRPTSILCTAHVRRRDLLGGLLHEYEAAA
jgi:hypothetical protein